MPSITDIQWNFPRLAVNNTLGKARPWPASWFQIEVFDDFLVLRRHAAGGLNPILGVVTLVDL